MATRLDIHLTAIGSFPSRVKAKEAILDGRVAINGITCQTPAKTVGANDKIEILQPPTPAFASHGGEKLEKAILAFSLSFANLRVLDIGASTGGFTECALRHGASRVYAIDVGHDQLLPALRADPRVACTEGLNARHLQLAHIDNAPVDAIVCDVSFISLDFILPKIPLVLAENGWAVLLVKPQFEVGPTRIRRGGLANNPTDHLNALRRIASHALSLGLSPLRLTHSPRLSPQKNIEYLLLISREPQPAQQCVNIDSAVSTAFSEWRNTQG